MGWEVKSLREGRAQLKESYVIVDRGELFLFGAHFSPLVSASTHVSTDPVRTRKLLLHRHEISHLIGSVERSGYTIVPLSLYWNKGRAKLRLEAAAFSEMAEHVKDDPGFRVPEIDWARTGRDCVTMEWIDGIKMSDVEGLRASHHDLDKIAANLIQSFLRHK